METVEKIVGGKIRAMKTINRKPTITSVSFGMVSIAWQCHGLCVDGNRYYWREFTHTFLPGQVPLTHSRAC